MKYLAVDVVGDEGAASVAEEALTAAGISVEVRRVRGNVYESRRLELEIRVPADDVAEARAILAALSTDAVEAALHETEDLPPGTPTRTTTQPPSLRSLFSPGTVATAVVALALIALLLMS